MQRPPTGPKHPLALLHVWLAHVRTERSPICLGCVCLTRPLPHAHAPGRETTRSSSLRASTASAPRVWWTRAPRTRRQMPSMPQVRWLSRCPLPTRRPSALRPSNRHRASSRSRDLCVRCRRGRQRYVQKVRFCCLLRHTGQNLGRAGGPRMPWPRMHAVPSARVARRCGRNPAIGSR